MAKEGAMVRHFRDVPAHPVGGDAPGASARRLIGAEDGAPLYALRLVELEPGGHTLHHRHDREHEVFVLEGLGRVLLGDEWHRLEPGVVVLVPGGVEHVFENTHASPLRFLCGDPIAR